MKKFAVSYCGEKLDEIYARNEKDAIDKIVQKTYFDAEEIEDEDNNPN